MGAAHLAVLQLYKGWFPHYLRLGVSRRQSTPLSSSSLLLLPLLMSCFFVLDARADVATTAGLLPHCLSHHAFKDMYSVLLVPCTPMHTGTKPGLLRASSPQHVGARRDGSPNDAR